MHLKNHQFLSQHTEFESKSVRKKCKEEWIQNCFLFLDLLFWLALLWLNLVSFLRKLRNFIALVYISLLAVKLSQ